MYINVSRDVISYKLYTSSLMNVYTYNTYISLIRSTPNKFSNLLVANFEFPKKRKKDREARNLERRTRAIATTLEMLEPAIGLVTHKAPREITRPFERENHRRDCIDFSSSSRTTICNLRSPLRRETRGISRKRGGSRDHVEEEEEKEEEGRDLSFSRERVEYVGDRTSPILRAIVRRDRLCFENT